ncbi:MAG: alpha/beta hydrolase [Gemmatimonadaceae bacterium]|nr:alpha/beta hydrolase [Gemmatimonadaceae bacterium]
MKLSLMLCAVALCVSPVSATAQVPYRAVAVSKVRGQPYNAYTVVDSLGRRVSFYLSESSSDAALPLVVYVHGSGHASHFFRVGDRIAPANGHASLVDAIRGRARVLIVEKPGVSLYDRSDAAPRPEFLIEHTLERWAEAIAAAVVAATGLPGVDSTQVLVVGHSEGGMVATRVARLASSVSHVGVLAGGGPSQLFDLRLLARSGQFFTHVSADPAEREAHVLAQWDSILAEPDATQRLFLGHPFRRWASFLRSSPIAELRQSQVKVFVAQGERDAVVTRESFDALVSDLLGAGRRPVGILVPRADHSFSIVTEEGAIQDGWTQILGRMIDWYLHSRRRTN